MQIVSRQPSDVVAPRIGALSVLPVFLDLSGKRAIVAGGSPAAAWKAELLMAAGASVEVFAEPDEVSLEMAALAKCGTGLCLVGRKWDVSSMKGAALAIADVNSGDEAAAFRAAAQSVGTLYNIIDKPDFCQFRFGTIVNRSPVVVGISTCGAAPILAQAIRRRIEAVLPPALKQWAGFALTSRRAIHKRLAPGLARRTFWEGLAGKALSENLPPTPCATDKLMRLAQKCASATSFGRVTLVGVGPGDAEHLTLKAIRVLQSADLILYEKPVAKDVLELGRREATRQEITAIPGTEPPGSRHLPQNTALILSHVAKGHHVVRLLPGNGLSFLAGKERDMLQRANVAVDIVPGVAMDDELPSGSSALKQVSSRQAAQQV